jgi:hypothetical protein
VAIVSAGFDQTIDEVQFARMSRFMGAEYAVGTDADFKVTPVTTADRTVRVAPGAAYAHGVLCDSGSAVNLQSTIVTSGSRWDTVVLRRDWQPPGGTATLMLLTGSATKLIAASRLSGPGVLDDQPLALVRFTAGQNLPQEIVDLRAFPSKVFAAADLAALPNATLGTEAVVGGKRWRREMDSSGNLAWILDRTNIDAGIIAATKTNGTAVSPGAGYVLASNYANRGLRIGNFIHLDISLRRTGAEVSPGATATVASVSNDFRPDEPIAVPMVYYSSGGSFGGMLQVYPDGDVNTVSGYPGESINKRTLATDISIRATASFMVKG